MFKTSRFARLFPILIVTLQICGLADSLLADEQQLDAAIAARHEIHDRLNGENGWQLVFHHYRRSTVEPDNEAKEWTISVLREGNSFLVRRDQDSIVNGYAWYDGVAVSRQGTTISVSPWFNPAASQIIAYTNYLFVDVSPPTAVWPESMREAMQSRGPSDIFAAWALPQVIESRRTEYKAESIDGGSLIRLTRPGRDEIVLDPALGFACTWRRYEFKPGVPLFEVESHNFKEVAPGLWLPQEQVVRKYYTPPAEPTDYGRIRVHERSKLISFEFRDLKPSEFQLPLPEDGEVHDQIRGVTYRKFPANVTAEEALESSIEEALSYHSGLWAQPVLSQRRWFLAINVVLLLLIAVAWRKRSLERRVG